MGLTSGLPERGASKVRLPPRPESVAAARAQVRELLRVSGRADLLETAELLVSEIVTNALLHAGTDIDLALTLGVNGLTVEVGDGNTHLPSPRHYAATSGTGRGLLMLEAMVDDWGVLQHAEGKVVWFRISGPENDVEDVREPRTESQRSTRAGADSVAVELRNMPLLLHAAWQEHAEALLREYLLTSLDTESNDSIQMHAEATDAIAVLEEHVPRAAVSMAADRLMREAIEPGVSADRVRMRVPARSVPHFATLDRAIEAALDLSREGLVLTPPSQPEVQAFRRWICRQVLRQAAGGTPEPWVVGDGGLERVEVPEGWDASAVTEAPTGLIAADATSHIVAVSPAATALLGYDRADELVGRRIVSIVPERFRQAHVAGFTMYLLVGRKPLLDQTVRVPALRRDGSEVDVELTVRSPVAGEGQAVLLADIRPVEV